MEKVKLLDSDLTELCNLHPAQARQLQKNNLVEKIPSNSELILRLRSKGEKLTWPLLITAEDLVTKIKERVNTDSSLDIELKLPSPITPDVLADLFGIIEQNGECVIACLFCPKVYADIRKFDRDVITLIENPFLHNKGFLSEMWGAVFVVHKDLIPEKYAQDLIMYIISPTRKITLKLNLIL